MGKGETDEAVGYAVVFGLVLQVGHNDGDEAPGRGIRGILGNE